MLKLIETPAFYEDDTPSVSILDFANKDGLEKTAASSEIQSFLSALDPKPGHTYLHIVAMSASEYTGSNRNHDFFPEENLKKYYKTFETNPAHIFRHHINKDPSKSYGKVIFASYNDGMHRVELIGECPDDLIEDVNSRIKAGDHPATSMACKTPYDVCSICGNKARSRAEYCTHLKNELGRLYPDGRRVMAMNVAPLSFHDQSIVVRPADPTSSVLQKVAYAQTVLGSAELAELEGLTEDGLHKKAKFVKLSELIKEINDGCFVAGAGKNIDEILGSSLPKDLPLSLVNHLHHFELPEVLGSFADLGISPSLEFLAELIGRKRLGPGYEGVGKLVASVLEEIDPSTEVPRLDFEESTASNHQLNTLMSKYAYDSSLFPSIVEKRASNIGYAGNGPHIEPNWHDLQKAHSQSNPEPQEFSMIHYLKLLLGIGGAALLAKYYITTQIDKKLREERNAVRNGVKISIVKTASDYQVTPHLAKLAMVSSIPPAYLTRKEKQDGGPDLDRVGISVTKRFLKNTNTNIGGKLANLLRIFSFGSKVENLG